MTSVMPRVHGMEKLAYVWHDDVIFISSWRLQSRVISKLLSLPYVCQTDNAIWKCNIRQTVSHQFFFFKDNFIWTIDLLIYSAAITSSDEPKAWVWHWNLHLYFVFLYLNQNFQYIKSPCPQISLPLFLNDSSDLGQIFR